MDDYEKWYEKQYGHKPLYLEILIVPKHDGFALDGFSSSVDIDVNLHGLRYERSETPREAMEKVIVELARQIEAQKIGRESGAGGD